MADSSIAQKRVKRSKRDDPKMIGAWKLGKTIGKGSSGRVKIARNTTTGEYAAVKIVSKQALISSRMSMTGMREQADKILLSIEREIVLMKLIDHPNVLSLYDVWETSNELYLILEYVQNGELFDHLVAKGRLSMQEALMYFQQIIAAVDYCHRFKIAHRDLKPENLLLDRNNNIKVADFGMAAWEGGIDMLETSCGSPHYASPEVVQGKAYKGFTSDIWSCGVILYALLVGRLPFDDDNIRTLLDKVKRAKFVMPTDIPLAAQDLIARMLEKDVDKRISMSQILVHPWFTCLPPKPLRALVVAPPSLETLQRPVETAEEIDPDILTNLRTLWHGTPDEQIIASLLSKESTWEKAVYTLLIQYRVRRLENYDVDDSSNLQTNRQPTFTNEKPLPAKPIQPSSNARNEAPDAPHFAKDSHPITPLRLSQPAGPRGPTSNAAGPASTTQPAQSVRLVQGASKGVTVSSQGKSKGSPQLPPIVVSDLGGPSMEQFLSQVASHVSRNKPLPQNVPKTEASENQQSLTVEDDGRFADAEDDTSNSCDTGSLHSSIIAYNPAARQSSHDSSPHNYGFGSNTPTTGSQRRRYTTSVPIPPARWSQHGHETHPHGLPTRGPVGRNNAPLNPTRPLSIPMRPVSYVGRAEGASFDKENTSATSVIKRQRADTTSVHPSKEVPGGSFLGRRRTLGDRRVQIMLPGEETKFGKQSYPMAATSSGSSSGASSSTSGERITWFGNLFKFKPATFHLLSVYDHVTTRDTCKRLLSAMGVLVMSEDSGSLICRVEDVNDPSGVMESIKAVRFRVEVHGVPHSQAVAGFTCSISLMQEKGALSTFKLIYNRLRREWQLDTPTPILKLPKGVLSSAMSARRSYDL